MKATAETNNLSAHFGSALDGLGYQQPPVSARGRVATPTETHMLQDVLDGLRAHFASNPIMEQEVEKALMAATTANRVCYFCSQPGHIAANCPKKLQQRGPPSSNRPFGMNPRPYDQRPPGYQPRQQAAHLGAPPSNRNVVPNRPAIPPRPPVRPEVPYGHQQSTQQRPTDQHPVPYGSGPPTTPAAHYGYYHPSAYYAGPPTAAHHPTPPVYYPPGYPAPAYPLPMGHYNAHAAGPSSAHLAHDFGEEDDYYSANLSAAPTIDQNYNIEF